MSPIDIDTAVGVEITTLMIAFLHHLFFFRNWLQFNHGEIAALGETAVLVKDVSDPPDIPAAKCAQSHDDDDNATVIYSQP